MSKGNSRKGNREIKKPKKDTVKVLATANTMTNPWINSTWHQEK